MIVSDLVDGQGVPIGRMECHTIGLRAAKTRKPKASKSSLKAAAELSSNTPPGDLPQLGPGQTRQHAIVMIVGRQLCTLFPR